MKQDYFTVIVAENEGQTTTVEVSSEALTLTEIAATVTKAVSAAMGYPVEAVLVTEDAAYNSEGLVVTNG